MTTRNKGISYYSAMLAGYQHLHWIAPLAHACHWRYPVGAGSPRLKCGSMKQGTSPARLFATRPPFRWPIRPPHLIRQFAPTTEVMPKRNPTYRHQPRLAPFAVPRDAIEDFGLAFGVSHAGIWRRWSSACARSLAPSKPGKSLERRRAHTVPLIRTPVWLAYLSAKLPRVHWQQAPHLPLLASSTSY